MIDHDYKIVTREVLKTESRAKHFIAELNDVYLIVDGKRTVAHYPSQEFYGKTQTAAMILANESVRTWLSNQNSKLSVLAEDRVTMLK